MQVKISPVCSIIVNMKFIISAVIFLTVSISCAKSQQWNKLDDGKTKFNGAAKASYCDSKGNLYIGGFFTNDSGNYYVAKWDETGWSELGGFNSLQATGCILTITGDNDGNIFAAGNFRNKDRFYPYVAKWDGVKWSEVGKEFTLNANWNIKSISLDKEGNIYAVGGFHDGVGKFVAQWQKRTNRWVIVRNRTSRGIQNKASISSIISSESGVLFVGGITDTLGKQTIMQWKDTNWTILGNEMGLKANASIETVCRTANGHLYAAGTFTNGVDSVSGNPYVAHWDGQQWQELKGTDTNFLFNAPIYSLYYDNTTANLYAAGEFDYHADGGRYKYIAKWNGIKWVELGIEGDFLRANSTIETVFGGNDGSVYAGGWLNDGSEYFVAKYSVVVLDVKIKKFKQVPYYNHIALSWQTMEEKNVSQMHLERSLDGSIFNSIKIIEPQKRAFNTYVHKDFNIYPDVDNYYYRIKVLNKDGSFSYSETIVATIRNQDSIKLIGNPIVNGELKIDIFSTAFKKTHVSVVGILGEVLFTTKLQLSRGMNHHKIPTSQLKKGTYLIRFDNLNVPPQLFIVN